MIAYRWWAGGEGLAARAASVGLCLTAGLIGWLFRPDLTVLDTEHVVALAFGILIARLGSVTVETRGLDAQASPASRS